MLIEPGMTVDLAPDETELLARATRMAGIGAWRCDLDEDRIAWTEGVYGLFGVDRDAPIDRRDIITLYEEASRDQLERVRTDAIARRDGFTIEAKIVRPDAEIRWIRISAKYGAIAGKAGELYGLKQDITADRARWEALRQRADYDSLTGLASRGTFQRDFLDVSAVPGTLVLFDIDGFKPINDRFGHAAGDACLIAVAQRLRAVFAGAAMVARIGGDEFAVVARGTPEAVALRARQALGELALPILCGGEILSLTGSAGLASPTIDAPQSGEALFVAADAALYAGKRAGRNRLVIAPRGNRDDLRYGRSIR
ncbi:diguanylate cyclase [Sphingomonas sp. S1-29]|uniref:GGDEF domain-containing protein n=1 Tax=Sphingomonas sp. S1-29 TaxID=2991074 RepID=UPI0022409DD3|nr:diguanylate cyclase [Sphingomonas sp. S1-29]UZK69608.1 diguanylate cyclase [Sphingomonas sp. S1-29]